MKKLSTRYVAMDPSRCVACWKCVEQCPKRAIGKVEILWHRHTVFQDADACIGCKKCIKTCPHGVFYVADADHQAPSLWKKFKRMVNIEVLLPLLLLATIVTGIKLHVVGHLYGQEASHGWLVAHVVLTVVFTLLTVVHIFKRRK